MLAALRLEPVDHPPVWFMRQAGRHLPGYRALREQHSFLDLCAQIEPNRLVSAEPLRRYGVDAVIVFNDILIPLRDMGMRLDFVPGPRFERLVATEADAAALQDPAYDEGTDVSRCLRALRTEVGADTAMLGFVGAPLTVAAFAIGGVGADRPKLSTLVEQQPVTFETMQHRLTSVLASYAEIQVRAGADAIQIFESFADQLKPEQYRRVGLPRLIDLTRLLRERLPQTPVIIFGLGLWPFVRELAACGAALSLDSSRPLAEARAILRDMGQNHALQGNLPPETLLLPREQAAAQAQTLLADWQGIVAYPEQAAVKGPTGWVFNLGHGVPAEADPATVQAVVDALRAYPFPSPFRAVQEHQPDRETES